MQYACGEMTCERSITILGQLPDSHETILARHGWAVWTYEGRVISVRCRKHYPRLQDAENMVRQAREIVASVREGEDYSAALNETISALDDALVGMAHYQHPPEDE